MPNSTKTNSVQCKCEQNQCQEKNGKKSKSRQMLQSSADRLGKLQRLRNEKRYPSIFSSLLTTVFASFALNRLSSAGLTIFLNLSTVLAILVGYFCLGETIHGYHLIGAAMILAGVVGTNAPEKQGRNAP